MEYLVIGNEFSGTDKGGKILTEVAQYLNDKEIPFTLWKTSHTGHATDLAREGYAQGYRKFFIVGGDGTFNEAINGLQDSNPDDPATLALIPAGSGNDLIRSNTTLSGSTKEMMDHIFQTDPVWIDCGTINNGRFLNVCGFGLDVDLALRQKKIKKYFKGAISYYLATVITVLNLHVYPVTYRIDDGDPIHDNIFLFAVGNGRSYGGGFLVTPEADLQDGLLDVCVVSKLPFYKVPGILMKLIKGKHLGAEKYVRYYKCKRVEMDSENHTLPLNIDGELIQNAPLTCEIIPHCIKVYI